MRLGTNGPPPGAIAGFGGPPQPPHLLHQALQEHQLLAQWVVSEAIAEGDDAVGEVVLRQPGHHAVLLHIGTARHVHDQVARVLPVPAGWGGGQPRAPGVETSPHREPGKGRGSLSYLTTSTAPARTLGSLPMMDTLAVKEPSMLKTTASVPRATTVRQHSA